MVHETAVRDVSWAQPRQMRVSALVGGAARLARSAADEHRLALAPRLLIAPRVDVKRNSTGRLNACGVAGSLLSIPSIAKMAEIFFAGLCQCGHTTFSATGPANPNLTTNCCCESCRTSSVPPVPFVTFAAVATSSIKFHNLMIHHSSVKADRGQCPKCKTPLTMHYHHSRDITWIVTSAIKQRKEGEWQKTLEPVRYIFLSERDPNFEVPDDGLQRWEGDCD